MPGSVDVSAVTAGQAGCLIIFLISLTLWSYAEVLYRATKKDSNAGDEKGRDETRAFCEVNAVSSKRNHLQNDEENVVGESIHALVRSKAAEDDLSEFSSVGNALAKLSGDAVRTDSPAICDGSAARCISDHRRSCPSPFSTSISSQLSRITTCSLVRCFLLDREALRRSRESLRACVELGAIIAWLYFADRRMSAVTSGDQAGGALTVKHYSRDTFFFLFATLVAVAYLSSSSSSSSAPRPSTSPSRCHHEAPIASILSRDQTEEWKGWMQVLFLMYHYFAAAELYNAIRVFIAAYVWMTGYGNFLYYVKTGDFSLRRVGQTLWRLNFLVAVCCVAMKNRYASFFHEEERKNKKAE
jgi:hypothetical protein